MGTSTTLPTFVLLCEAHGVCRSGFRKKACRPFCTIKRSDLCQESVPHDRSWGFHQCSRRPVKGGQGHCGQHAKRHQPVPGGWVSSAEQVERERAQWAELFFRPEQPEATN